MSQWHVTQGDNQFAVDGGLGALEAMARRGGLGPGDMIQPPGTSDWMYASEVPELKQIFDARYDDDDDNRGSNAAMLAVGGVVAAVLLGILVIGGGISVYLMSQMSGGTAALVGEGGLSYSEMIVTAAGAGLRAEPSEKASVLTTVTKDDTLQLLAKRGGFYKARTRGGAEGWIAIDQVIPLYQLGGAEVREEFDPLYNPDRYVEVANARWMQLPADHPTAGKFLSNRTIFEFMMSNSSRYPMTDLRLVATIKDAQGHELEKVEIPIEGMIPGSGSTMVGTLAAEEAGRKRKPDAPPPRVLTTATFEEMAASDPELQMRWTGGVEVEMKTAEFSAAQIDVVELRAVPDAVASKSVSR
ncbi:MAG: SH3 domain-containing protein [Alphaproteobacteria bacterium]|nr:SH3 domain-containing protein [Alphaproteobacteria bacterium]MCB9696771.1 SH3 domain-containing protein [Alphaproteobacteria bacterium]